jgi:hypothetical protein
MVTSGDTRSSPEEPAAREALSGYQRALFAVLVVALTTGAAWLGFSCPAKVCSATRITDAATRHADHRHGARAIELSGTALSWNARTRSGAHRARTGTP